MVDIILRRYDLETSDKFRVLLFYQVKMLCEQASPEWTFATLRLSLSVKKDEGKNYV